MHTRYRSKRWSVVNSPTVPTNSLISLGSDNYIVEDSSITGKTEFGSGYKNTRALATGTFDGITFGSGASYIQEVETGLTRSTFYIVELKTEVGNELFNVKQIVTDASLPKPVDTIEIVNEYNMLNELPVSEFSLITPTANKTVPQQWTVFKWNRVANEVPNVTQYTVGVTGYTNSNPTTDIIRTRSSIPFGTYNTVLSSTNPNVTAPFYSITIADAIVSADNTQIVFRRSEGVSNYKIQFATNSLFTNLLSNQYGLNSNSELSLDQALVDGLYPSTNQTINITELGLPEGVYYWRMRAFVPGDDVEQRDWTAFGSFTKGDVTPPDEDLIEGSELYGAFDEDLWE